MRIAIVGATGRTGREVVRLAVRDGHHVVAVVRNPDRLNDLRPTEVRVADGLDVTALSEAIQGVEAIVMCVGPVKGERADVLSAAITTLIEAMGNAGVERLVAITASGWLVDGDDPLSRFLAKPILARALREENAAFASAERSISASPLEWTIVRPPMLKDGPATGSYRQRRDGNVRWHYSMRRADLARAMLDVLEDPTAVRSTVAVTG
ncbi:NAD(P)H-binding protein [Nocardiopsis alba]|uniref:NAD(P)H-binding protein n=1 Tax=Nocardiopsis alba TaxID=53437 RepID=A0A7K2IPI7_9ACTN|nr:NAD(P)H-binding protein [Nocardiopsis alba]MYR31878.1 NAD(P)H-binding protein [Nocardiopsis alba]